MFLKMAEGRGFEPPVGLRLRLISSQVPLTTQPPFLRFGRRECCLDCEQRQADSVPIHLDWPRFILPTDLFIPSSLRPAFTRRLDSKAADGFRRSLAFRWAPAPFDPTPGEVLTDLNDALKLDGLVEIEVGAQF